MIFNIFGRKSSLPPPRGPFQVGYLDVMTPGSPDTSSLFRIHYPAPAYTHISSPPVWAKEEGEKLDMLGFMQKMAWDWPSWANKSEFLLQPYAKKLFSPSAFININILGWSLFGTDLTIPIQKAAPLEPHTGPGWPVVVFSHGMGCNRFTMSQLCYQLASKGVMVISIEHREGSGFGSFYKEGDSVMEVPMRSVAVNSHEYEVRNRQVNHRCREVIGTIEIIDRINAGETVRNVIDDANEAELDILKSSMDMKNNLFLMGHSFGGATVLLASSKDSRVKGVLALDPWMFPLARQEFEIAKPALVINMEVFRNQNNVEVIKEASNNPGDVQLKVFKDGVHMSATDIPSVFTQGVLRTGLGFMDKVKPETVMIELNKLVWDWMKKLVD